MLNDTTNPVTAGTPGCPSLRGTIGRGGRLRGLAPDSGLGNGRRLHHIHGGRRGGPLAPPGPQAGGVGAEEQDTGTAPVSGEHRPGLGPGGPARPPSFVFFTSHVSQDPTRFRFRNTGTSPNSPQNIMIPEPLEIFCRTARPSPGPQAGRGKGVTKRDKTTQMTYNKKLMVHQPLMKRSAPLPPLYGGGGRGSRGRGPGFVTPGREKSLAGLLTFSGQTGKRQGLPFLKKPCKLLKIINKHDFIADDAAFGKRIASYIQ